MYPRCSNQQHNTIGSIPLPKGTMFALVHAGRTKRPKHIKGEDTFSLLDPNYRLSIFFTLYLDHVDAQRQPGAA